MKQATRFSIVDIPQALPGSCFLCEANDREFFVDTGRQMEFHGAVYFCSSCLSEIGTQAEYAPPELRRKLEDRIETLEKTVYELTVANEGLEEAVNGLRRVRSTSVMPVTLDSSGVHSSSQMAEQPASAGETPVAEGEGNSPESVHGEGSSSVPDSSESSDFSLSF